MSSERLIDRLKSRRTILLKEPLIKKLGGSSDPVTRMEVDSKLTSLKESKKREWLERGFHPALVEKALLLADEWPASLAEGFLPNMPEAQKRFVELNYPKALKTAERWLEEMSK